MRDHSRADAEGAGTGGQSLDNRPSYMLVKYSTYNTIDRLLGFSVNKKNGLSFAKLTEKVQKICAGYHNGRPAKHAIVCLIVKK